MDRRLVVYVSESRRRGTKPLWREVLDTCRRHGLSGATATRGLVGFGASGKLHEDLTCALEDTVPTAHAKIRSVIDRRLVSRPEMEAIVRSLFLVSRCDDRARVSEALRAAAQGEPLPLPAAGDGRRPAGALLGVALEPVHDRVGAPERGAWAS